MKNYDIVFNSEKENDKKCFRIASDSQAETTILFEKENIAAVIYTKGQVEFYNMKDELLSTVEIPSVESDDDMYCQVDGNSIILEIPKYTMIDHYPNCDGEYDRWSKRLTGYKTITFDTATNAIV